MGEDDNLATCIRKVVREVLGVTKVNNMKLKTHGSGMRMSTRLSRRRCATRVHTMIDAQATW